VGKPDTPPLGAEHVTNRGQRRARPGHYRRLPNPRHQRHQARFVGRAVSYGAASDEGTSASHGPRATNTHGARQLPVPPARRGRRPYLRQRTRPSKSGRSRLGPDPECVTSPVLSLISAGPGGARYLGDRLRAVLRWLKRRSFYADGKHRPPAGACRRARVYFLRPALSRGGDRASSGGYGTRRQEYISRHIQMRGCTRPTDRRRDSPVRCSV